MSKFLKLIYFTSLMTLSFTINSVSADEKMKFESDAQLHEVFKAGDMWECKYKNTPPATGHGTKLYTYQSVSLEKTVADVKHSYCPEDTGTFEGKFKKGKLIGNLKHNSDTCADSKGHYVVYKKKDGNHYMKGPYSFKWTDGNTYKGNTTCHPK